MSKSANRPANEPAGQPANDQGRPAQTAPPAGQPATSPRVPDSAAAGPEAPAGGGPEGGRPPGKQQATRLDHGHASRHALSVTRLPRALPVPAAVAARRWMPSLVWLVPILVVLLGVGLAVRTIQQRGPTVTITFATAEGLEAHKTTIKYKSVAVGLIKSIELLEDRSGVVVTADLSPQMAGMLVADARFWVVRPRVSAAGVSGMGTLLTGAHVAFDAGVSPQARRAFVGLEAAPSTISDRRGRRFTLRAENIGSIDVGSPLYLRRFQVGQVTRVALAPAGDVAVLEVFVDAPYDRHVTTDTRFWNASGVDVTVDARGIKLDSQSLASVLVGGIALETPPGYPGPSGGPAPADTAFHLFSAREAALRASSGGPRRRLDGSASTHLLVFGRPVRGLEPGAPVELMGLEIGEVLQVEVEFDGASTQARTVVTVELHPERIRVRGGEGGGGGSSADASSAHRAELGRAQLGRLIQRGLRARLRTANVFTGQRFVAFEMVPGRRAAPVDWTRSPVALPTEEGAAGSDGLQEALTNVVAKLDRKLDQLPMDRLVRDGTLAVGEMRRTFERTSALLDQVGTEVAPGMVALMGQTQKTLKSAERTLAADAPLQQDLRTALRDLGGAGQALRSLAEYLERHPESLVYGKKQEQR